MTANPNLLTLNPSKTEFLLIELKNQLDKISLHNSSLNTTHSASNLDLWWTFYLFRPEFSRLQRLLLPY